MALHSLVVLMCHPMVSPGGQHAVAAELLWSVCGCICWTCATCSF